MRSPPQTLRYRFPAPFVLAATAAVGFFTVCAMALGARPDAGPMSAYLGVWWTMAEFLFGWTGHVEQTVVGIAILAVAAHLLEATLVLRSCRRKRASLNVTLAFVAGTLFVGYPQAQFALV